MSDNGKGDVTYMLPDNVHVLIGTPNFTNVLPSETFRAHVECAAAWRKWGIKFNWMIVGRTFVHFARSQVCQAGIDGDFSHIFWLDDDAIIDPEVLPKLLQHDKDVVITPYPMRRSPFQVGILSATSYLCRKCNHRWSCDEGVTPPKFLDCPMCGRPTLRDFHAHSSYRNLKTSDLDKGLIDVDGGGTHAMLVKTECLKDRRGFPPPGLGGDLEDENHSYPDAAIHLYRQLHDLFKNVPDRELVDHYIGDLPDQSLTFDEEDRKLAKPYFTMPKSGTEDMLWCYRAKCKGIEIYADTDVWADHIGFAPVVTRAMTEKMETYRPSVDLKPGEVCVARIGERGRDHTKMVKEGTASLV